MNRSKITLWFSIAFLFLLVRPARPDLQVDFKFTGSSFADSGRLSPPDTDGAEGGNRFVELLNGVYAVWKDQGTLVSRTTLNNFWKDANPTGNTFDPRVVYDPSSQRFFAVSLDNDKQRNDFLVAVSKDSDPSKGWFEFKIDSNPTSKTRSADFPTLGFNRNGVFVTANMYVLGGGGNPLLDVLVLPKADLLRGSIANKTLFENQDSNKTGYNVSAAVNLNNSGQPEYLIADYNPARGQSKEVVISGAINNPKYDDSNPLMVGDKLNNAPNAVQKGGGDKVIQTGVPRYAATVVQQGNNLWAVENVDRNGRSALHWLRIDAKNNQLLEEGYIQDAKRAYYYGSIAVSAKGQIVVGFTASGPDDYAGVFAIGGKFDGSKTAFEAAPVLVMAGASTYGVKGVNPWGDYSATMLDPTDPSKFWTIQEWAGPDGGKDWRTEIVELSFTTPEPNSLIPSLFVALLATGHAIRRRQTSSRVVEHAPAA
jgi:hypothetical protein